MRQSIISIYEYLGKKTYSPMPIQEIIFRQPYHNLGLAYSFNFTKSFFAPISTAQISIQNPSADMINALRFDPAKPMERPKIEIRAGESNFRLDSIGLINTFKTSPGMDLVYTGHPYFFTENKFPGGKTLNISCSDMDAPDRQERSNKTFRQGEITILLALQSLLANTKCDFTGIQALASTKLQATIYSNNLNVQSQILPDLSRVYKFHYFRTSDGTLKFEMAGAKTDGDKTQIVSPSTGLIEYPTQINWCFWNIKTFFGRPQIFYPGQWMTVDMTGSTANIQSFGKGGIKDVFKVKSGMVTEAKYNFNDTSAEILYIISPDGYPVESMAVLDI